MKNMKSFLSAHEAAAELNVSRATLYAYVSRGLIRSEPMDGSRQRLYRAEDVRGLRARKSPGAEKLGGGRTTAPGSPVLESAITLIADEHLYYRGSDVVQLAAVASLETVAGLLWNCGDRDPFAQTPPPLPDAPAIDAPYARVQALLAAAAPTDLKALNLQPWGVACTGARLVRLMTAAFIGGEPSEAPLHEQLAHAWRVSPEIAGIIRAALVLCADHELNVSTYTVRCVASARSTPYAAVLAGLSALQGPRHGGETARVAALFDEAAQSDDSIVANRLQRGESLPGIGHFLYAKGDPRYTAIMTMLAAIAPKKDAPQNAAYEKAHAIAAEAKALTGMAPNIDFGLVTLQRALKLPPSAPLAIFAIGRCIGWIAHAQEQYARPELIRPRARYIGEHPQRAHRF
jgi:citrate synthase